MDIKAMAKSKRSHTKHNQPRKPHQNPPKPTSSNNNPSNLSQDTKEKKRVVPQKPSLPSNWDRYDDNSEEEAELGHGVPVDSVPGEAGFAAADSKLKKAVEGVQPKSKGADFRYLIAQAKESKQHYSPSYGDTVDDFYQGLAPMLAVKSEGFTSWDRDDDFLMENEAATIEEASRFSLNFEALAEELAKADLAKRLFIEPDLLPPELRGPEPNDAYDQVPDKRVTTVGTFKELYSIYLADKKLAESEDANEERIVSSTDSIGNRASVVDAAKSTSNDTSYINARGTAQPSRTIEQDTETKFDDLGCQENHVTAQDSKSNLGDVKVFDARQMPRPRHTSKQDTPSSEFVADAGGEELDILLSSFNETKVSTPPATRVKAAIPISQQGISTSKLKDGLVTHQASLPHSVDAPKPAQLDISLDDELDDLLGASNLNSKGSLYQSTEIKAGPTLGAPLQHLRDRSTLAFPLPSCSLDDELDSLLEETSKPTDKHNLFKLPESETALFDFPSSSSSSSLHPGSKAKALDDFDSWLDTIS